MGEILKGPYIPIDQVTIDGALWQQIFLMEAPQYFIVWRQCVPLGNPKNM